MTPNFNKTSLPVCFKINIILLDRQFTVFIADSKMLHTNFLNLALILWCCVLCIQFKRVVSTQLLFNDDVMVIEGDSVSSSQIKLMLTGANVSTIYVHRISGSEIKLMLGGPKVSKIYVYLTHTFYADEDLKLNGISEFQVFASTWNVTNPVTFDLSGTDGEGHERINGSTGIDGGNFFGLTKEIINGGDLTVISNGVNHTKIGDGGKTIIVIYFNFKFYVEMC